jgi:hypothetical protein
MTRLPGLRLGWGWESKSVADVDVIIRILLYVRRNVIGI